MSMLVIMPKVIERKAKVRVPGPCTTEAMSSGCCCPFTSACTAVGRLQRPAGQAGRQTGGQVGRSGQAGR